MYTKEDMSLFFPNSLTWDTNEGRYLDYGEIQSLYQQVFNEQNKVWEREDSAYQRMVEDMKKAGLNPWTGIESGGASASAQSPTAIAASSLIQALSYNLDRKKLNWSQNNAILDRVLGLFDSVLRAI